MLAMVTQKAYAALSGETHGPLPSLSSDPHASNLYSTAERHLLSWLNYFYNKYRSLVWQDSDRDGVPPKRWVVNFDLDLMDGLVLGSVLGAYVPFLVRQIVCNMLVSKLYFVLLFDRLVIVRDLFCDFCSN